MTKNREKRGKSLLAYNSILDCDWFFARACKLNFLKLHARTFDIFLTLMSAEIFFHCVCFTACVNAINVIFYPPVRLIFKEWKSGENHL